MSKRMRPWAPRNARPSSYRSPTFSRRRKPQTPPAVPETPSAEPPPDLWQPWTCTLERWLSLEHTIQRTGPDMRYVSPTGQKTLWPGTNSRNKVIRFQHRFEVQQAINAGCSIPAEVLADYRVLTWEQAQATLDREMMPDRNPAQTLTAGMLDALDRLKDTIILPASENQLKGDLPCTGQKDEQPSPASARNCAGAVGPSTATKRTNPI